MTQLCSPRHKAFANPIPAPPRGLGTGEGAGGAVQPWVFPWDPSRAQFLDSVLGLGVLGLAIRTIFSVAGPALLSLLVLLLVCFLTFDLLHRPTPPAQPQHRLLATRQSQGAGEGPGQRAALLLPTGTVTGQPGLRDVMLLLLMGLGLLLGAHGMAAAPFGLALCLHLWA
ncbi:uncharacterized protein C20orf141 homolog [Tupaia chinensis]|uniref:Uncharacterized protein n=1 Tax=Tupaia chinensis TaxID=246437 RepID=L8YCJ7_TUPCH|nr:uncharacterized protein C20orf141 homolog [Tupaia chinensis]ELV12814.1 hypothetical protein TREES_T100018114 [Tupaia chinensis]